MPDRAWKRQERQGVKAQRYVVLALEDWLEWHGPGTGAGFSVKPTEAAGGR